LVTERDSDQALGCPLCSAWRGGRRIVAPSRTTAWRTRGRCRLSEERCDLLCLDLLKAEALRAARRSEREARELAGPFKALGDATRLTIALA
jgi:hypothetical protein